ncbi:MAG TPA: class I SAM-dependent methyltransferase [Blastocatellia bacterium]|nr:class I SAM-dependent methyltransferase [Blastocatellia bacterium]
MPNVNDALEEGHYAKKQIFCKDWLISWSHNSRFQIGLRLARQFAGQRILDYGCGDGTFLAMLMAGDAPPGEAVGAEVHSELIDDCLKRFGDVPGLDFAPVADLQAPAHREAYDAVFCMEVLEHVVQLAPVLESLAGSLKPEGKLLISVPVETGMPLLVKQAARRIAGWRGLGDYKYTSAYTLREYCASLFPGKRQHIARPIYKGDDEHAFHDHKGFNWKVLREILSERFHVEATLSSPITWLPPQMASQVWFIARKK